jgi:TonB family protein
MRVESRTREVLRYVLALPVAVALVFLLAWGLAFMMRGEPLPKKSIASAGKHSTSGRAGKGVKSHVRFVGKALAEKDKTKDIKPPPVVDLNGQVVETAKPMVEQRPDQAKYLGRYDMKVAKEQKSKGQKTLGKDLGKMHIDKPSALQSPQSASQDPTQIPKHEKKLVKGTSGAPDKSADKVKPVDGPGAAAVADSGETARQGSPVVRGKDDGLLLPATSPGNVMHNIQALSGNPGGNDYLPDVEDEGDTNLLNTRRFKYWDFFQRVKDRVSSEWEPGSVWRTRDPSGNRYGVRARLTILRVKLDPDGAVKHLDIAKKSGLEFLDDEAERAFSAAGPFPNPPRDMMRNGEIEFQFGFMFEISSQKFKFFRVPQ